MTINFWFFICFAPFKYLVRGDVGGGESETGPGQLYLLINIALETPLCIYNSFFIAFRSLYLYTFFLDGQRQHVSFHPNAALVLVFRFFSLSSSSTTCMMLCINAVFPSLELVPFLFSVNSVSLILHVLRNETMAQSIKLTSLSHPLLIWVHCWSHCREKRAKNAGEIYVDSSSVYIINEYFQQLKCKKEGLCVYAVLKVNLFIASITETAFCTRLRSINPPH